MMLNPVIIHNNNILLDDYQKISFDTDEQVNLNIERTLDEIDKDFTYDVIVIKDSLSLNYLDFYGLLVLYHIRLSENFKGRLFPIIVVSDLKILQINKLTSYARALFTKGVYFIENNPNSIETLLSKELPCISEDDIRDDFLTKISIEPPSNYESNHSIANEWSIYTWSNALGIDDQTTQNVSKNIESMLYFKYLQKKHLLNKNSHLNINSISTKVKLDSGKILYIDDEWQKGWKSIFTHIFNLYENISFRCLEEVFKDKEQNEIIDISIETIKSFDPDVVLLDLRLHDDDFSKSEAESLSGIKLLNIIKQINPGIQVIILTASEKSLILEEAMKKGALGYIKKEHPESFNLTLHENIEKLLLNIQEGINRRFLKNIYLIKKNIIDLLSIHPFNKYDVKNDDDRLKTLEKDILFIYDILDSKLENRFNYAMVSIATSLEAIVNIFLRKKANDYYLYFWDGEETYLNNRAKLLDKINKILIEKLGAKEEIELETMIEHRNKYMHANEKYKEVTSEKIEDWFEKLYEVLKTIDDPPAYTKYIPQNRKKKNRDSSKK